MDTTKALFGLSPYPDPSHQLPKPVMFGGAALMVAVVALCATGHATGVGVTIAPAPVTVVSRDLVFTEADDGVLTITDADHGGRVVDAIAPGESGFIRAMVRGLTRNRTRYGEPAVGAFRVSGSADGGVFIQDLGTRQNIDLRAFGPTQVQAIAHYLQPDGAAK